MEEERRKCVNCGALHRLTFFRITEERCGHAGMPTIYRKSVCKECERREREDKKLNNPEYMYKNKARNTLSKHASRNGMTLKEFCDFYDLSTDYIAYLFKKEWLAYDQLGLPCPSCRVRHTDEDPLIFEQLTLDRIDRTKGYYQFNVRIACRTYNTGKGSKNPMQYDLECRDYREHEEQVRQGIQFNLPI